MIQDILAKPKVEIIIVSYNNPEMERYTLQATARATLYPNVDFTMRRNAPGRHLSAFWNELIAQSDAEYICLLNPDTIPATGWLTKLVEILGKMPKVGAVVPSSNAVFLSQVDVGDLQAIAEDIDEFQHNKLQNRPVTSLPTLSAMCVLFRRKAWENAGGFDERFRLYGEDSEFFWRLKNKNDWELAWRQDAFVWHIKNQTMFKAMEEEGLDILAIRAESETLLEELTGLGIKHEMRPVSSHRATADGS